MMNGYGVHVSIEVPVENLVSEITYEGQEILEAPLSISDNLTRLAHRIDFSGRWAEADDEESDLPESQSRTQHTDSEGTDPEPTPTPGTEGPFKTLPVWPWEQVRNKMRTAFTELSVLSDILQLTSQKKYLVLDPVSAEPPEPKIGPTMIYKKRGLSAASLVLTNGASRLEASLNEAKSRSNLSSNSDFHIELLRLRQNWRLRKVGNVILGDLSYKTAGSRFPQSGIFEVRKFGGEEDGGGGNGADSSEDPGPSTPGPVPTSALRVIVPKELQGVSYIQVIIRRKEGTDESEEGDGDILSMSNLGLLGPVPHVHEAQWQQRLEAAQNVLFCRELFSVLAREAVALGLGNSKTQIPPLVVGSQITATLFPGVTMSIGLCHSGTGTSASSADPNAPTPPPATEHNHVLEHSLHQLLRDVHRANNGGTLPHPATAQVGVSKKRRLAGPLAYDRHNLTQMSKKEGILEEMIAQAQHFVLRQKTTELLDTLAKEIKDPLIIAHWSSLNAVRRSSVRLNLHSSGYDMTARTPLLIHVQERTYKVILKDGKSLNLSYEADELRDVILSQIGIHQIMALQSLSKCLGWTVLSSSCHLGQGPGCQDGGNAAGCVLSSPNGLRHLAVRSNPLPAHSSATSESIQVLVGMKGDGPYTGGPMIYKPIVLEKLEGKNFLNKLEMFMALLNQAQLENSS